MRTHQIKLHKYNFYNITFFQPACNNSKKFKYRILSVIRAEDSTTSKTNNSTEQTGTKSDTPQTSEPDNPATLFELEEVTELTAQTNANETSGTEAASSSDTDEGSVFYNDQCLGSGPPLDLYKMSIWIIMRRDWKSCQYELKYHM